MAIQREGGGLTALLGGAVLFLAVLLFADLEPGRPEVTRTAAVAVLMAAWWITGALPLGATALVPVMAFPFLGVLSADETAGHYINDIVFLFIGGFLVAIAMEQWDLHRRLALKVLTWCGGRPRNIALGLMVSAFGLSMWISNTATVMMLTPIVIGIIRRVEEALGPEQGHRFAMASLLGIAYTATIGGTATLVGTAPNLSFARIWQISFPEAPEIAFSAWFVFGLPLSICVFGVCYSVLHWRFLRGLDTLADGRESLARQYAELGPITPEQRRVMGVFLMLVTLWITRADVQLGDWTVPGWAGLFEHGGMIKDGTVALSMGLLLFLIPAPAKPGGRILERGAILKLPWDIVLLFGGGFALAAAFRSSGLADWLGGHLVAFSDVPPVALVLGMCLGVSFLTELTSNTATTEMLLPVLAAMAVAINIHPMLLMIPATLTCSYAFMLPVATPPNAIVFGAGNIRVHEMARTGILINIGAVVLVTLFMFTWGQFTIGQLLADPETWMYAQGP